MKRISSRFGGYLVVLAILVSIPVYLHSGGRSYQDDCANPEGLRGGFDHQTGHPVLEKSERLSRALVQWTEGLLDLDDESGMQLEFAIARSYIPSNLYTSWPKLAGNVIEPEIMKVRTLDVDGDSVPVRVLLGTENEPSKIAVYLLVYRHQATVAPFTDQLASAIPELFSTLPPMTLFFVSGTVPYTQLGVAEERAVKWLENAWRQYRTACLP